MEIDADLTLETPSGALKLRGSGKDLSLSLNTLSQFRELLKLLGRGGRAKRLLALDQALVAADWRLDIQMRERRLVSLGRGQIFGRKVVQKLSL